MATQEQVKNDTNYISLLDHGFVGLVDHMGNDDAIVQAARVSYGAGTKKISEDRGLIRYLVRHLHTTPLEMVEFKFHCRMPIFVARQWIRHRTANVNEYSGRYSEMPNEMYVPEVQYIKPQSVTNKQGREGELSLEDELASQTVIEISNDESYKNYQRLLGDKALDRTDVIDAFIKFSEEFSGIARETARSVLPLNTYTEWYWKIDLHNLFHFLKLRMDKHAQYEIRVFAEAMFELIKPIVPIACEAFTDFIFDQEDGTYQNYVISKAELEFIRELFSIYITDLPELLEIMLKNKMSKREIDEFKRKFRFNHP